MNAVLSVHSIIRWAVLIFGVLTVIQAITGIQTKRAYSKNDNIFNLLFMVFCDIQLLMGLLLLFLGSKSDMFKFGMKEIMNNKIYRFYLMEHGMMMIVAWLLVHMGRVMVKKAPEEKKHKKMLLFFGLALLIILVSIPWSFRVTW